MQPDNADTLAAIERFINENIKDDRSARFWPIEHAPGALADVGEDKPWAKRQFVFITPPGFPSVYRALPPVTWVLKNGWAVGIL